VICCGIGVAIIADDDAGRIANRRSVVVQIGLEKPGFFEKPGFLAAKRATTRRSQQVAAPGNAKRRGLWKPRRFVWSR
jgi:hypothetical protein